MSEDVSHTFTLRSEALTAVIARRGAELVDLRDEAGRDLLWNGDPAFWTGRAPLLFPIIGRLKDDRLTVDGRSYPMKQHGFARASAFEPVAVDPLSCILRLEAGEAMRQSFPFPFVFDVTYAIEGRTLRTDVVVRNPGDADLPVSMGFHPAFRWPLPYGAERGAHVVAFAADEPGPIAVLADGLIADEPRPSPVRGRMLTLDDALFDRDALVWRGIGSRSLRYGPPDGRGLRVDYPAMPDLGIWTKPGAGFLCIEPWSGYASPAGFDGEFARKPGVVAIPPGAERRFGMAVTLDPP